MGVKLVGFSLWECESSIPAAPATQSLDLRVWSIYARNPCNLRGFLRIPAVSANPKIGNFGENLPKVSGPHRRNSRFRETVGGDGFDGHCVVGLAVRTRVADSGNRNPVRTLHWNSLVETILSTREVMSNESNALDVCSKGREKLTSSTSLISECWTQLRV